MPSRKILTTVIVTIMIFTCLANASYAQGNEYDAVCNHLKSKYGAKKIKIPFMWLARAAVGIVRPAGVKSFKVTTFRNLNYSPDTLHNEMTAVMSDAFSEQWTPILRIRSREGDQVYMTIRETGNNVKILLVSINREEAQVIRARFNPERLAEFIENPEIFGISIDGG